MILWKKLTSSALSDYSSSFMKLELTKSPEGNKDAFRFYIKHPSANGDISHEFAKASTQASGLFVPEDMGINIFDGKFHHIVTSWSTEGLFNGVTTESGAGAVLGYIDGYKLKNREQTQTIAGCEDGTLGPVPQANMFKQTYPIKTTAIKQADNTSPLDGCPIFIGVSNNLSEKNNRKIIPSYTSDKLRSKFDGQIQSIRIWNYRLNDSTTGVLDKENTKLSLTSDVGLSFSDYYNSSLTTGTSATHIVNWLDFKNINASSASDVLYGTSAQLVGFAKTRLYDAENALRKINILDETTISAIDRTVLYKDIPEKVIDNNLNQGRIVRVGVDNSINKVGIIYYDLGLIVLDNNDENAKLNFIHPNSGSTGDFGFSKTGNQGAILNVERLSFKSVENVGNIILESTISGNEFNYSQNISSRNLIDNDKLLDEPVVYVTSVGLYDDEGNLLAIAKLSNPTRKDDSTNLKANIKLTF